jgi:rhomboid protease GluP
MTSYGMFQGPFLALGQMIFGEADFQTLLQKTWGSELLVLLGAKINSLIITGQWWRLFTPALLHASLLHVGFNMYALYAIGPSLESYYGHWRFLGLYILGAFGGNVLSFLMTSGLSVGASTAIFALIAAEGVFIYQNRAIFGPQARNMLINVIVIVVANLLLSLSPGVDIFGHLGGLLAGLLFGWFAGPRVAVEYIYHEYQLVDQRSPAMAWLMGAVVFLIFAGIALWRIQLG